MTPKEYENEYQQARTAKDLKAPPIALTDPEGPAKPHRTVVAAGVVFGLILAATLFLTVLLMQTGGH